MRTMAMEPAVHPVEVALDEFIARYQRAFPELLEPFDPAWRSPCELGEPLARAEQGPMIRWQPHRRTEPGSSDFAGLERALELSVHPDIKRYYGRYWSAGLEAEAPDGHVSLIFLWNEQDVRRLTENLIGHALAKQRARSSFSVFFACTEPDSELFLSVDNDTGAVLLERPGYRPMRQVAEDLASFIRTLQPAPPTLHPERMGLVEF